ncbi:MAG: hypothetical protein KGR98_12220 [Verrucomicrobia bacterium]|nr:hypothetical protein [Verrucomicrobiota bacterium]MDE3098126.1 hypothetical protein [Verrucomicrobiota bacterium]
MNTDNLQKKLIAAARTIMPSDDVPYAFEKRIIALLESRASARNAELWVRGLWRAAFSCVILALLCGAWAALSPQSSRNADLSQSFETTLLASVDQADQQ